MPKMRSLLGEPGLLPTTHTWAEMGAIRGQGGPAASNPVHSGPAVTCAAKRSATSAYSLTI